MPINKLTPYRHSDKSINVSLYYLRAQIIREGLDGLAHVDALLKQRGCDPEALHVPPKRVVAFRHGDPQVSAGRAQGAPQGRAGDRRHV